MTVTVRKRLFIALWCALFVMIFALNVLTPFAGDDYYLRNNFVTGERMTSPLEILPSVWTIGQSINGRYVCNVLSQLVIPFMPDLLFDVLNSLVYLLFLYGIYAVTRGEKRYDPVLLLGIAAVVFIALPDFGGPMLWMTGSISYLWGAAFMVWTIKPFMDAVRKGKPAPGAVAVAVRCLLSFITGNYSENMSATMVLFMFLCAAYLWLKTRKVCWWMVLCMGAALVGWLLLILAPADSVRLTRTLTDDYGLSYFVERFKATVQYFQAYLMPFAIVYFFLFAFALERKVDRDAVVFSALLFVAGVVCNGVMFIANYYPYRTVLWPCVWMLAACALLGVRLAGCGWGRALWHGAALYLCFLAVLAMCQALPDNYDRYRQNQARVADMEAQRDAGVTDIVTFGIKGKSKYDAYYGAFELTTDPNYVINLALAKELGVHTVIVDRFE